MAEDSAVAARERGGIGPSLLPQWDVPDGVDAGIDTDEPAHPHPVLDRTPSDAKRQQLLPGHVPMLLTGQGRNRLV